jgi:hypothetical protein
MLPRTHAFLIDAALARGTSSWGVSDLPALLQGHRDEDDVVVLGLRFRAAGLTHTYRPSRPRFGELWAPSARTKMLWCLRRVARARTRERAAWWMGRACHLLGDMAVPARTRGVWHLEGDPFEAWLEARTDDELAAISASTPASAPDSASADAIAAALARTSASFPADTTRTPWGRAMFRFARRGVMLDECAIEAQARVLLPHAIRATASLLAMGAPGRALHRELDSKA